MDDDWVVYFFLSTFCAGECCQPCSGLSHSCQQDVELAEGQEVTL